jgi:hypothetical protein
MLVFLPPVLSEATYGEDYHDHIQFAGDLLRTGHLVIPHFLFHVLLNAMVSILGSAPTVHLAAIIGLLSYGALGTALYVMLLPVFRSITSRWAALFAGIVSLCIIMLGPVNLLSLTSTYLLAPNGAYLGYLVPDALHNPTITLMRPFALLLFLVSLRVFTYTQRANSLLIAGAVVLSLLGPLAKPSFTICLLPCLCLAVGYALLKRRPLDWKLLVFGIFLPSLMVLSWQYWFTYSGDAADVSLSSHVVFAPLRVYDAYTSDPVGHFLASILFPLLVTLLYWKRARQDRQLLFAWGLFIIGCMYTYLLAEDGPRMYDGNFTWSAQITAFILLVSSVLFFARQFISANKGESDGWGTLGRADQRGSERRIHMARYAAVLSIIAFVLHLAGGLYLYGLAIVRPW